MANQKFKNFLRTLESLKLRGKTPTRAEAAALLADFGRHEEIGHKIVDKMNAVRDDWNEHQAETVLALKALAEVGITVQGRRAPLTATQDLQAGSTAGAHQQNRQPRQRQRRNSETAVALGPVQQTGAQAPANGQAAAPVARQNPRTPPMNRVQRTVRGVGNLFRSRR